MSDGLNLDTWAAMALKVDPRAPEKVCNGRQRSHHDVKASTKQISKEAQEGGEKSHQNAKEGTNH